MVEKMEKERDKIKKKEESLTEKIRRPIVENIAKGLIGFGLIFNPVKANAFYDYYYLYYPEYKEIAEIIDKDFDEEKGKVIKEMWNAREKDMTKKAIDILTNLEIMEIDLEEKYNIIEDKKKFYLYSILLMKQAEFNTIIDTKEKERLLYLVRDRVTRELEKDPYNVDTLELVLLNDKILKDMYQEAGYYIDIYYEDARKQGRLEIKNIRTKFINSIKSFKEHYDKLNELLNIDKNKRTSIFDYSNREKKKKIKRMIEKFENDMIGIEMDLRKERLL